MAFTILTGATNYNFCYYCYVSLHFLLLLLLFILLILHLLLILLFLLPIKLLTIIHSPTQILTNVLTQLCTHVIRMPTAPTLTVHTTVCARPDSSVMAKRAHVSHCVKF